MIWRHQGTKTKTKFNCLVFNLKTVSVKSKYVCCWGRYAFLSKHNNKKNIKFFDKKIEVYKQFK